MAFSKGVSGNPQGRPKGRSKVAELRKQLDSSSGDLINKVVDMALQGDSTALTLCMNRIVPPLKARDMPVAFTLEGDSLLNHSLAVLRGISMGEITPDTGTMIINAINTTARTEELAKLKNRLNEIERILKSRSS